MGRYVELEQLRQLETVSRVGTISAAAKVLRISQPALSRSIARLERELGVELFDRVGRNVTLNQAGAQVLEHASVILREERLMREALSELSRSKRMLRVGTTSPAPLWRLSAQCIERFPERILASELCEPPEAEAGVYEGRFELAIIPKLPSYPSMRACHLMTESLMVSLPFGHPLEKRESISMRELDGETFLLFSGMGYWRSYITETLRKSHFLEQPDLRSFLSYTRSSNMPYFSSDALYNGVYNPKCVDIPLSDPDTHVDFWLVARENASGWVIELFEWVEGVRNLWPGEPLKNADI